MHHQNWPIEVHLCLVTLDCQVKAIRHPLDQQAEEALRSVPGFDLVARKFLEFMVERPQMIFLMGNNVQVGPRQYATLYQLFRESVHDLDVAPEPDLFVAQNPQVNAYSLGEENPYIVVNTGLLDLLTPDEIRTVLAHELGHIKCGHSTLIQMAIWAMNTATMIGEMTFGLGNVISSGLVFAFYEWRRKAELSADRAALLATDDLPLVMQTMLKIAGGSHQFSHEISVSEFERQAEAYRELDQDELNQLYKFLIYNGGQGIMLSHPFPVERVHYLKQWATSELYAQIKAGNYERTTVESPPNRSSSEPVDEVEQLQRQFQELQQQFDQLWRW